MNLKNFSPLLNEGGLMGIIRDMDYRLEWTLPEDSMAILKWGILMPNAKLKDAE
jgi:hypothetical protein